MAEFSFVAPVVQGKTGQWRKAIAEIRGARDAAYKDAEAMPHASVSVPT